MDDADRRPTRPTSPSVDPSILSAARAGDRGALERLLRDLQDPWYRMCLALLGNADKAHDAVQETALRFLRELPGFRGDSQLRTWSLGIALNVARESRRASRREAPAAAPVEAAEQSGTRDVRRPAGSTVRPGPEAAAEAAEQSERLHATLAGLPDRQREAIVLRFFEELSVEETAAAMGCAPGTVKATVHQALRSLRQRLGHADPLL